MAKIETFESRGGAIHIQVVDEDGPNGAKDVNEIARIFSNMGESFGLQMEQLAKLDNPPGEIVISYGVKVFAGGAAVVSLNPDDANFRIELKWNAGGGADTGTLNDTSSTD